MRLGKESLYVAILALASCTDHSGPSIVVSDVRILAPMPGSDMGVAYLKIENRGNEPTSIRHASSPQFEQVEFHSTIIEDGVSRMRRLNEILLDRHSSVVFEAGGKHIMLLGAVSDASPGSTVTLNIEHDGGSLIVGSKLLSRLAAE